jgi:hypothetical protein
MSETAAGSSAGQETEEREAREKITLVERDYWRVRNGKQRYLRCPYCTPPDDKPLVKRMLRRNYFGSPHFCCWTFAKVLKLILDRQDEVDKAANAARRACAVINTANAIDQGRVQ